MQLCLQCLARRQHGQVLGHVDTAFAKLQQFDLLLFFARAQDNADGRRLARLLLVLCEPPQVQFHLTLVLRLEGAELQFDRDKAFEFAVVEQQVEIEVIVVDGQSFLARHEREACAELQ